VLLSVQHHEISGHFRRNNLLYILYISTKQTGFSPYQYRKKIEAYIREHENHIVITKLKRNIPLTNVDLASLEELLFNAEAVESRERFEEVYGKNLSWIV